MLPPIPDCARASHYAKLRAGAIINHDLPTEELSPAQAEKGRGSSGASVHNRTLTWIAFALL